MTKFLGIDAGSISIGAVLIDENNNILKTGYEFHQGMVPETLKKILSNFDLTDLRAVFRTSSTPDIISNAVETDRIVALIKGACFFHKDIRALLIAGGEKSGLVQFDDKGGYLNFKSNSSCAAGTGSFLDQQARRLNLSDIQQFCDIALSNDADIPSIASRCSVFAKTDLIHAQQEGYSLAQICDGLSFGLAKNIADTLFNNVQTDHPVVFAGGVARNRAVIRHLEKILNTEIITGEYPHLYGAFGSAVSALEDYSAAASGESQKFESGVDVVEGNFFERKYFYPPLELKISEYPDFDSEESYEFIPEEAQCPPVEVDIYEPLASGKTYRIYAGIDIGSTSTKAVLLDSETLKPAAGCYTRTSGRPIEAVKGIFESIENISERTGAVFEFLGAATTGSGRNFIGGIIGADLVLDEISAHARAAYEIDNGVDTIIEIGGQDAKFTTLKNGMVTFSIMNNVCAAGTGSFIEEQAGRLNCGLSEYSSRAEGIPAPMASDRCTVFMERDVSYLLSEGYSVSESLAAVLHSVRENYLTKVAVENHIGNKIFFQGATAKNRALVAAFEQRLGKPIIVSKFCHLTGAYGAALNLAGLKISETRFRGIDIYRQHIPVESEICNLCANSCKIKVVTINGETEAFGFLCGRDYDTKKFVKENSSAFDFVSSHKKLSAEKVTRGDKSIADDIVVGIPAALHMTEELPLWKKFFELLSIKTLTSESYREAVKEGKRLAGAEFCAPMAAMHGHVKYLSEKTNFVFFPFYLEEKNDKNMGRRQYCYYTQYAPSLASAIEGISEEKIITPMLKSVRGAFFGKVQLYKAMKKIR